MLLQEINRYSQPVVKSKGKKPHLTNGSFEHKKLIFNSNLATLLKTQQFTLGDNIRLRRSPKMHGVVINIEEDFDLVKWDGLKACFVEVYLYNDNHVEMYHPSDLKGD